MGASNFLDFSLWVDFIRGGEGVVNQGQLKVVIHWLKDLQSGTSDVDTKNEVEFIIRYLEELEGKG